MHHPTNRITHTTSFVILVVEHWLEWEIAQWVHHEQLIQGPIAPWVNALTMELTTLYMDTLPLSYILVLRRDWCDSWPHYIWNSTTELHPAPQEGLMWQLTTLYMKLYHWATSRSSGGIDVTADHTIYGHSTTELHLAPQEGLMWLLTTLYMDTLPLSYIPLLRGDWCDCWPHYIWTLYHWATSRSYNGKKGRMMWFSNIKNILFFKAIKHKTRNFVI